MRIPALKKRRKLPEKLMDKLEQTPPERKLTPKPPDRPPEPSGPPPPAALPQKAARKLTPKPPDRPPEPSGPPPVGRSKAEGAPPRRQMSKVSLVPAEELLRQVARASEVGARGKAAAP